mmetsp:Transcript_18202/g.30807  ORF Transcript_18202/g.30807 Transcript_18202/m.30807 type:complete len:216 (-) Transcript_18202:849-1496(-)
MACCMDNSQSTGETICSANIFTMSCTELCGPMAFALALQYTVQRGGIIFPLIASNLFTRIFLTSAISLVWKAPACFKTTQSRAPAVFAFWTKLSMADRLPETEKALEKRHAAIWHVSPLLQLALHCFSTVSLSKPTTKHMPCALAPGREPTAKSMASARSLMSRRPVSKSKTPAQVSAAYSPTDRPATARHLLTFSSSSSFSCSIAARLATYMAG